MEEGAAKQNKSEVEISKTDSSKLKISNEPNARIEMKDPTTNRKVGRMSLR